jgi:type IV pilus assembly protein PilM
MAKPDRNLSIDIGSTGIRMTEFEYPSTGGLILHSFKQADYSQQVTESNRTEIIADSLRKAYEEGGFAAKNAAVCVSGQAAFMRFVSLPPVSEEESRIKQIVEYEAKQNVPFPMDEVIWDYQLLSGAEEDLEVMFVVIKHDIVESVTEAVSLAGLKPEMVDFAPSALYNVSRANHIGDSGCGMVLNIGGRCTTLLFLDGQRFFARTIPIGGFSITQQVAKEFGLSNEEGETLKRRHGFVALGGAYEEPESEVAATISKIVRNVMTRLHGEVNRSISVYRTQQKGNKPSHLYLCGGSSTMAYTDTFFSEKLRMEVSYLNPFKIVTMGENMDVKQLSKVAHTMAECVGVGLRSSLECPVEISLIPETLRQQQSFGKKKPFITAAAVVWILMLGVFIMVNSKTVTLFRDTSAKKKANVERLNKIKTQIEVLDAKEKKVMAKINAINELLDHRYDWSHLLNALQLCKPQDVWLSSIKTIDEPKITSSKTKKKGKTKRDEREAVNPFAKKKKTAKKAQKGDAMWFDIAGYAIAIPSKDPRRNIFTDKQIAEFNKTVAAYRSAINEEDLEKEFEMSQEELDNYTGFWGDNVMQAEFILPEIFLESLQWSEMFSDNPDETKIVETRFSEIHRNLTTFRIQLKLEEPIGLKR